MSHTDTDTDSNHFRVPKRPASESPGDKAIQTMDRDLARFVNRINKAVSDLDLDPLAQGVRTVHFSIEELRAASMLFQFLGVEPEPAEAVEPASSQN